MCNSPDKKAGGNSVETSEDGEESSIQDDEDSVRIITEILSSIEAPLVSKIARDTVYSVLQMFPILQCCKRIIELC